MLVCVSVSYYELFHLDGCSVPDEGSGHLKPTWRNVAHGSLDVVGDPVLHVKDIERENVCTTVTTQREEEQISYHSTK